MSNTLLIFKNIFTYTAAACGVRDHTFPRKLRHSLAAGSKSSEHKVSGGCHKTGVWVRSLLTHLSLSALAAREVERWGSSWQSRTNTGGEGSLCCTPGKPVGGLSFTPIRLCCGLRLCFPEMTDENFWRTWLSIQPFLLGVDSFTLSSWRSASPHHTCVSRGCDSDDLTGNFLCVFLEMAPVLGLEIKGSFGEGYSVCCMKSKKEI